MKKYMMCAKYQPYKGRFYALFLLLGIQFSTKQCFFLGLCIHVPVAWKRSVVYRKPIDKRNKLCEENSTPKTSRDLPWATDQKCSFARLVWAHTLILNSISSKLLSSSYRSKKLKTKMTSKRRLLFIFFCFLNLC